MFQGCSPSFNKLQQYRYRTVVIDTSCSAEVRGKADGGGLYFTLSASGTAAWIFRYRYGGEQKEYTIGRYPDISLSDARKLALRLRNQVNDGIDVAMEKNLAKQ